MCEANAYVYHDGVEELYLEGVDILRPEGDSLLLISLFGKQKLFEGEIRKVSLLQHKIVLKKR